MSVIKNNTAPQITHTSWLAHLLSHWSTGQEEQSALRKGAIPSKVHPEHLQFVLLHEFEEQVQSVIDLLRSGVTINRPWTCGNDVVSLIDMVQGLDTIKPKTSELLYSIWDVGFSAVLGRHECAMQDIMFRWSGGSKYLWCEAMLCAQLEWGDIAGNILHWALLRRHYKQITIVLDMVSFLKTQTPAFHKKYVNIPMSNGDTAIHLACRERLLDPTKRLCKHRCVELLKNANGFTAAHECALNNFVEGLEILEVYTTKDSTWYDAIHDALRVGVQHGHIEIVKKCIEFGGDVCQEGLLALAVSQGHLEIVHGLCVAGSDPNIRDRHNKIAIEYTNDMMLQRTLIMYGSMLVTAEHVATLEGNSFKLILPLHNYGILHEGIDQEHRERILSLRASSDPTRRIQNVLLEN